MIMYMAKILALMWVDVSQAPGESDRDFILSMFQLAAISPYR